MYNKVENPELFRANFKNKINALFDNDLLSSNLEKGIFNYTLQESNNKQVIKKWDNPYFIQIYLNRMRTIIFNLKQNKHLIDQVKKLEIKSYEIAFMTHYEMSPDKWNHLLHIKSERDKGKFNINIEASTDTFTCRKCRGNKTTYYQLQIKSSDEPMTTFINCITCGNRWKIA
jgi:transcription elongation factor S-II